MGNPNFSRLSDQKPAEEPVVESKPKVVEESAPVTEDNERGSSRNFEDFGEQDDGATPIEIEKTEEVNAVVEEVPVSQEPVISESSCCESEAAAVETTVESITEAEPSTE